MRNFILVFLLLVYFGYSNESYIVNRKLNNHELCNVLLNTNNYLIENVNKKKIPLLDHEKIIPEILVGQLGCYLLGITGHIMGEGIVNIISDNPVIASKPGHRPNILLIYIKPSNR